METNVSEIAKLLDIRKRNGNHTVLFLGARAGGLFRNAYFYETIKNFSMRTIDNLSDNEMFRESYTVLSDANRFTQVDVSGILFASFNQSTNREEDKHLAKLVKEYYFDIIISTNIDGLLERAFQDEMKGWNDFDVFIAGDQFKPDIVYPETKYCTIVKTFGDLKSRRYHTVGNEFNLDADIPLKRFLESTLKKNILLVGFDPKWDQVIERAFPMSLEGDLWYVNEEPPPDGSLMAKVIMQRKGKSLIGPKGSYESFIKALYEHLMVETLLRDQFHPDKVISNQPQPLQATKKQLILPQEPDLLQEVQLQATEKQLILPQEPDLLQEVQPRSVFVIRPFEKKKDSSGKMLDFERVHNELIDPALKASNLGGATTGEIVDAGNIREDMFSLILEADLVICDITINNANVFYELGIRHALRKKRTILIKGGTTADGTPFDLLTDRYLSYDIDNPASTFKKLVTVIKATLQSDRETDSPIFLMLPTLMEADTFTVQALPLDFREEVERARAAKSKGWLRLLAQDLHSRRFQWRGLQLVANAQWDLKDYVGARESFEAIHQNRRDSILTSLALANIYERLYRKEGKLELLKASDQAIEQVLASKDVTSKNRAEALALKGRNQKTQWRRAFENIATVNERRMVAMNQELRECYEAYRKAFYQDLNHFYSGLAAMQMGTIFLDLSAEEDGLWKNSFDTNDEAEVYRRKLAKDVEILRVFIPALLETVLNQLNQTDPERAWAEISKADALFLTEQNEQRVIRRYKDAIPKDNPFAWDAAKGQLQLFADLGVRGHFASVVITAIDNQYMEPKLKFDKPLHVVLFAGHRIDAPGRVKARFPAQQEDRAKQLIRADLRELDQSHRLVGLASAAPGADILFHEVCDELNIPSSLCLPIPAEDYARLAFEDLDDWRSRFLNLLRKKKEVLELSDRDGLPRWLYGANTNPWERGNRWVLQMALTSEAETITLLTLWDGKNKGDAPGGTAHMVQMARNTGKVHLEIIDTEMLLK